MNYDSFLFAIYIRIAKCRTCEIINTDKEVRERSSDVARQLFVFQPVPIRQC